MEEVGSLLRALPQVDELLKEDQFQGFPRQIVLKAVRQSIDKTREDILKRRLKTVSKKVILQQAMELVKEFLKPSLTKVINATGIVIHTNLGRAPLAKEAIKAIVDICEGYSNLEYDLKTGRRGKRYDHLRGLLKDITGAEDAIVVNNNAAAVLLCLSALARGKEVIVSRGELVEIGGSFRVPDVMLQSGAVLKEVGTTNKTHIEDYQKAISENTAMLLKVHRSNYRIVGFTEEVSIEELVSLGQTHSLVVMYDLGSGCLFDLKQYGVNEEPMVQEIIAKGVDIVTFSGDKLLGGPQGGIILGKKELIERIASHPLTRALRIDKMTLAAMEATLRLYFDPSVAKENIPVLKSLLSTPEQIKRRAQRLRRLLREVAGDNIQITVEEDETRAGGGALPEVPFRTYVVAIDGVSAQLLQETLRTTTPPVIGRVKEDKFILDMRTVGDNELFELKKAFVDALNML